MNLIIKKNDDLVRKMVFIFLIIVFLSSCSETVEKSVEGEYIGNTNSFSESNNSTNGYHHQDTMYLDTFSIILIDLDSIVFKHKNFLYKFKLNEIDEYPSLQYSFNSGFMFKIRKDTLFYSEHSYGGNGINYNRSGLNFKGTKQD